MRQQETNIILNIYAILQRFYLNSGWQIINVLHKLHFFSKIYTYFIVVLF